MNRACFLDRDGVIIEEVNYIASPHQVKLIPEAAEALRLLHEDGFMIIVVSNQSGVARGFFDEKLVGDVNRRISGELSSGGAMVDAWYFCPHHPKGTVGFYARDCDCRKPAPGLFIRAAGEHKIDLGLSFMIGDKYSDLLAAEAAGCADAVLVRTGHGLSEVKENPGMPFEIRDNILEAVKYIKGR
jgi:D-glycero-D-manno-heptose 1,7-bisphosphate phosphatase